MDEPDKPPLTPDAKWLCEQLAEVEKLMQEAESLHARNRAINRLMNDRMKEIFARHKIPWPHD